MNKIELRIIPMYYLVPGFQQKITRRANKLINVTHDQGRKRVPYVE